ncbi:MAG: DNRLRE domain-containing protein [Anaerolineae bacterium]|uniref:DNRLRE domain-containing protein n=1 Tax=Candidatus Amarolinea dominans TaxID=3140696 RepID=UPI003135FEAF|nr:DNRLRE domain-containing protein [Anaerolineae bacterium]
MHDYQEVLQDGVNGYSGTSDTFLDAWMPMMPYGADANFYVRQPGVKSALVQFDLAGISSVAYVSQAQIGVGLPTAVAIRWTCLPTACSAWSEAGATWMEADAGMAWETPGAMGPSDRSSTAADRTSVGGSGRWVWFDVTDLAQMWVMDPTSNHGIVVMGDGSTNAELEFTSSDYIVTFVRPQMKVIYQAP